MLGATIYYYDKNGDLIEEMDLAEYEKMATKEAFLEYVKNIQATRVTMHSVSNNHQTKECIEELYMSNTEVLKTKLLARPIESDTTVKSAHIDVQDEYLFLFEESIWDGISISSVIVLKEQFSKNFTKEEVETVLGKYYKAVVNKRATYSVNNEYIFYNYQFEVQ